MLGLNQYLEVSITNFMVGCMSLVGPGDREGSPYRLDRGELRDSPHPPAHSTYHLLPQPHCIYNGLKKQNATEEFQGSAYLGLRSVPLYPW